MIVRVCIHPQHRRRSYATKRIVALCNEVLGEGLSLCLFYDNPNAGRIYKQGYWKVENVYR